jgi:acyl-CoA synthetase (AMP-forming)/AMP-acid ligase II
MSLLDSSQEVDQGMKFAAPPGGLPDRQATSAMRLSDYLDKGASIDPAAPCLTMNGRTRNYALPRRHAGEIVVRGPLVMAGYYRDEAATAQASRFGWNHTGDTGYLDAKDYLYLVEAEPGDGPVQDPDADAETPKSRRGTPFRGGLRQRWWRPGD